MTIHAGCGLMDQERHTLTGEAENQMTMEEMRIARTCLENGMIYDVPMFFNTFVKPRVGDTTIVRAWYLGLNFLGEISCKFEHELN